MEKVFTDQTITITGNTPYEEWALERIALLEGGTISNSYDWDEEQLIVIGREDFDRNYLIASVEFGLENEFTCQYLSQEDFWHFWLYGEFEPYFKGDQRIASHEGLSFLASIGFKWPSISEIGLGGEGSRDFGERRLEHELRSIFGYSVRKGIPERNRRASLKEAVTGSNNLGLRIVATHIAGRIQENRRNKIMEGAIERWKSDLEWLRKTYYEKSKYSFRWPSY